METTKISFPDGETRASARVVAVRDVDGAAHVVLDRTPFHPVDHTWPDQPGDHGTLVSDAGTAVVVDTVVAAEADGGEFAVGTGIPAKRGAEGWTWLVAHRLDADAAAPPVGATVTATVDVDRRAGLSRGHTACHLASLALDLAVADLWRKDPGADGLGNPDFEGRANQTSFIHADGAVDEYRLGKSLRRAGFDTEAFAASLADRAEAVNATLASWVASGAPSTVETDGDLLTDRRRWRCELPAGVAVIPCGGTHVGSLAAFAEIRVELELMDPQTLVMRTDATPA